MTSPLLGKQYNMKNLLFLIFIASSAIALGKNHPTQQRVDYKMQISLNDQNHTFEGQSQITYYNHSSDTLREIYFHLYFNAFQPGSDMDVRSLWIADPDPRVGDRISKLKPDEYGHQHLKKVVVNGQEVIVTEMGTIAKVVLKNPILPKRKQKFH